MEYRMTISLPAEWSEELKIAVSETSVPAAVLARQWIIERLRELRRERHEHEREQ